MRRTERRRRRRREGCHQVRGLGRYVQAGGNAHALERLALDEVLADDLQDLHRLVRPLDTFLAEVGKLEVFYVTRDVSRGSSHNLLFQSTRGRLDTAEVNGELLSP